MNRYPKEHVLSLPDKAAFVKKVKQFADAGLSHLFTLEEKTIIDVLTALSYYCEHGGIKATKQIYEHTMLQMVQYQDGACGHRFELWAM